MKGLNLAVTSSASGRNRTGAMSERKGKAGIYQSRRVNHLRAARRRQVAAQKTKHLPKESNELNTPRQNEEQ